MASSINKTGLQDLPDEMIANITHVTGKPFLPSSISRRFRSAQDAFVQTIANQLDLTPLAHDPYREERALEALRSKDLRSLNAVLKEKLLENQYASVEEDGLVLRRFQRMLTLVQRNLEFCDDRFVSTAMLEAMNDRRPSHDVLVYLTYGRIIPEGRTSVSDLVCYAIPFGYPSRFVEALLQHGSISDEVRRLALREAIFFGGVRDRELVQTLLAHGNSVSDRELWETTLSCAIEEGRTAVVQDLLARSPSEDWNRAALRLALKNCRLGTACSLLRSQVCGAVNSSALLTSVVAGGAIAYAAQRYLSEE